MLHDRATALGTGIDGAVRRISLEYNARGLMTKIGSYDNATVGSGTLINEVARSYDVFNQLAEDVQSHSGAVDGSTPKVTYSYADGSANTTRRLSVTYPSGKLVTMSYGAASSADDRLSRLAGVSLDGESGALGEFTWMGAGRLVELAMPQPGLVLSYRHASGEPVGDGGDPYSGYDRFGRTVDMRWIKILSAESVQSVDRIQYGYDRMDRRLWRQDLAAPADTQQDRFYGYDGLGQVKDSSLGNLNINRTAIAGVPAEKEAFDYDSIGNWKNYLRQAEGITTLDQTRWNNRDNQITSLNADANGLAYDAAGNMTACRPDMEGDWTKGYTMVWDAWNRLVAVRAAGTDDEVTFCAYDGLTRRLTSTSQDVIRHHYYNSVWKCVEERLNSSTDPDCVYYWSGRSGHRDELLRRDRTTSSMLDEPLWCLMDYFDPIAITNSSGEVQERYSYSAFGLASVLTPAFEPRSYSSFAWNFLFHGQFRDVETTGWDNYGYRYYLPWLGRWPSRDPIGERGGVNLFVCADNNLVNSIDLMGLRKIGKSEGAVVLRNSLGDLQKECECCSKDKETCKQDAEKIVEELASYWEQNWGNGPGDDNAKGSNTVGNKSCWDWAKGFKKTLDKSVASSIWENRFRGYIRKGQEGRWANAKFVDMHFSVHIEIKNPKGKNCNGFDFDDGFFDTSNSLVHGDACMPDSWPPKDTPYTPIDDIKGSKPFMNDPASYGL